ncbi:Endoglucanase a [Globisporangium polare]
MTRAFHQSTKLLLLVSAALALTVPGLTSAAQPQAQGETLCSLSPISYAGAKQNYPESASAIAELEQHSIATWYSDRNGDYVATAKQLVTTCPASSRLSVVVYGLPNKDCEARSSAAGSTVTNSEDYKRFIQSLVEIVGDRKALYVLEPDAVGLLAKVGGCGAQAGYRENLLLAIELLSANPNAEIYLDVGYWTLAYPESTARVAQVVKDLAAVGRVKGITLNTSNFRNSAEMSELCSNFQVSIGTNALNCIVDTSRNYNGSPSTEWCNVRIAGIGSPPSSITGFSNLDYFMWIKPPGESDGQCDTGSHTADAMAGPEPGAFFNEGFKLLWNQGYFVKEFGLPMITDGAAVFPATRTPAPMPVAQVQVTSSPEPSTEAPASSLSPTMAPEKLTLGSTSLDPAVPSTSSTPAEAVNSSVAAIPSSAVELPDETPCPPTGSVSGAAAPATPFPSQPSSSSLAPVDAELLNSVQQRHSSDAAVNEQPLSPKMQQQMDEIAFNTEAMLHSNNDDLSGDSDSYDDAVGVLPTSEEYPVDEVPESVFLNENRIDGSSSSGSATDSSSGSGSKIGDVNKFTLVLVPRGSGLSTAASQAGSGSNSVSTLSAEKLVPSSSTAPEAAASTSTTGGTNRTEVLASLAVLGCVGALAVAMAVVSHKRKREALMEARLTTPETTIIHITPASSSIA